MHVKHYIQVFAEHYMHANNCAVKHFIQVFAGHYIVLWSQIVTMESHLYFPCIGVSALVFLLCTC